MRPHSWLSWPLSCPLAQSLTTCEVCGACFETRKGLSSHARSHLRQLGVAESESSGAPIDLLYELVKQKGLPDTPLGLPPGLTKKSSSPKEVVAGAPRQSLLTLAKPLDAPAINKAIKSPPGFSAKGLAHPPSSPLLKKAPLALAGSPIPKNPEDKSPHLSLSPRPASPKAQWPQSEDEGPLNLSECGVLGAEGGTSPGRVETSGWAVGFRVGGNGDRSSCVLGRSIGHGATSPVVPAMLHIITCLPLYFAVLPAVAARPARITLAT